MPNCVLLCVVFLWFFVCFLFLFFPSCISFQLNQSIKVTGLFSSSPSSPFSHFGSFYHGRNLKAEYCPLLDASRNGSEAGGLLSYEGTQPTFPGHWASASPNAH